MHDPFMHVAYRSGRILLYGFEVSYSYHKACPISSMIMHGTFRVQINSLDEYFAGPCDA